MRKVVVDLKESGVVQRAVLGISFRAIDQQFIDEMGEMTGIDAVGGLYVASVTAEGAASEAGIRKGDIITSIEGIAMNDSATLLEQIGMRRPGDKVDITVRRGDKTLKLTATLQNRAGNTALLKREFDFFSATHFSNLASAAASSNAPFLTPSSRCFFIRTPCFERSDFAVSDG